jgi:hypothetical protein
MLVTMSPPSAPLRVGGGPYTLPVMVSNASRLSSISLTISFDATRLRARSVQEGSFMRAGGAKATFTQQATPGRVDITVLRPGDATGAAGAGVLAAVLFDALQPGSVTLTISGVATAPGGAPIPVQMRPISVNVEQ